MVATSSLSNSLPHPINPWPIQISTYPSSVSRRETLAGRLPARLVASYSAICKVRPWNKESPFTLLVDCFLLLINKKLVESSRNYFQPVSFRLLPLSRGCKTHLQNFTFKYLISISTIRLVQLCCFLCIKACVYFYIIYGKLYYPATLLMVYIGSLLFYCSVPKLRQFVRFFIH